MPFGYLYHPNYIVKRSIFNIGIFFLDTRVFRTFGGVE